MATCTQSREKTCPEFRTPSVGHRTQQDATVGAYSDTVTVTINF